MLPSIVIHWPSDIILVWSRAALIQVCNSGMLKRDKDIPSAKFIARDKPYAIVVFVDSKSSSLQKLYGGEPVLVYDVSSLRNPRRALSFLQTPQRKRVFALHLPFWSHYFTHYNGIDPDENFTTFFALLAGSKHLKPEEFSDALMLLLNMLRSEVSVSVCGSCFKQIDDVESRRNQLECFHSMCDTCRDVHCRCLHVSHKREIISAAESETIVSCANCGYAITSGTGEFSCKLCKTTFYCTEWCMHNDAANHKLMTCEYTEYS